MIDPNTGKSLFIPQIGRPPLIERNVEKMPIGNYLYITQKKIESNKKKLNKEMEIMKNENFEQNYTLSKSNELIEEMKKKSINIIFDILDSDHDGKISHSRLNLDNLPYEISSIFSRLFKEMKESKCVLNKEEFIMASNNLFNLISIQEKGAFLRFHKETWNKQPMSEIPFRPIINSKSKQIASKIRGNVTNKELPEILLDNHQKLQVKLNSLRTLKNDKETNECTFKPSIHKKEDRVQKSKPVFYY